MQQKRKNPSSSAGPVRTCVVCRGQFAKDMLQRYVWEHKTGTIVLDRAQTQSGRGAYCCREERCEKKFLTHKLGWKRFFRLD